MTEEQWRTSTDPQAMLTFLRDSGNLSERKARLFAMACCRQLWDRLAFRAGESIDTGERNADGVAGEREVRAAQWQAREGSLDKRPWVSLLAVGDIAACIGPVLGHEVFALVSTSEKVALTTALRDIFGPLPFRTITIPPPVRAWNDGLIQCLAEEAYHHRLLPAGHLDPERLGVLADALEEAGADAEMVGHLRGPGPHVRGCAVVDLLTGRE